MNPALPVTRNRINEPKSPDRRPRPPIASNLAPGNRGSEGITV
jgi:hypothetical protein